MPKLSVGDAAPDFSLASDRGDTISLRQARVRGPVVLIFYVLDNTPT